MNIEEFAKSVGVVVIKCDTSWGGTVGYTTKDHSNVSVCGFRSEKAAYKDWFNTQFGEATTKTILKLLKLTEKL